MDKKMEVQNLYPLSPMQEGMLYHALLDKGSGAYVEQMSMSLHGALDLTLLEHSLNALLKRYDILRTIFVHEIFDSPKQVVLKERLAKIHYEDLTHLTSEKQSAYLAQFKENEREQGFDLSKDILVKLSVFKLTPTELYEVHWSHHHILMDGWCVSIVIHDLLQIYRNLCSGSIANPYQGLTPAAGYSSYIKWLKEQDKVKAGEYWADYLQRYENEATLPHQETGEHEKYVQAQLTFALEQHLTSKLLELARSNQATISSVCQTVWGILLQRYANLDDVAFGAVVAGRPAELPGIERMVGLFINTLPVRVTTTPQTTFVNLLEEVQMASVKSRSYEFYPLAEIQTKTVLKQKLFDHIFVFENFPVEKEIENLNDGTKLPFAITKVDFFGQTNYDLNVLILSEQELSITLKYNSQVYAEKLLAQVAVHFRQICAAVVENPDMPISDLDMLSLEEKVRLLVDLNCTDKDFPETKTLHQLFTEQVQRTPEKIALIAGETALSYRELNDRANHIARALLRRGVHPDECVGLLVNRSIEIITGMLGIMKAGAAYLPLDSGLPSERISYMVQDSGARIVLVHPAEQVPKLHKTETSCPWVEVLALSEQECRAEKASDGKNETDDSISTIYSLTSVSTNVDVSSASLEIGTARNLAYIIYTSGSTGLAKGVAIEHRSVVNYVTWFIERGQISADDSTVLLSSYAFDLGYTALWGALIAGAILHISSEEVVKDASLLIDYVAKQGITFLKTTPSFFNVLINSPGFMGRDRLATLRLIVLGGEKIRPFDLREYSRKYPEVVFMNHYGPTEATIGCISTMIQQADLNNFMVQPAIGKPNNNIRAYILDRHNRLVPDGVMGELYLAGAGLARGYLQRPELNQERFVTGLLTGQMLPGVSDLYNERLYRTGDLVRRHFDGNIEFMGRVDQQVKIRGFRVEPGEVENLLKSFPTIEEACVIGLDEPDGGKYLAAYIVSKSPISTGELRNSLLKILPEYMVPSYFIQLEAMPLTPNGKIDRRALPSPEGSLKAGSVYVAPVNELQAKLVAIWRAILGVEQIGIEDNFFDLGGHSLKATQLVAKIFKELKVELSLRQIFQHPTIAALTEIINSMGQSIYAAIPLALEREYYPLSSAQKRMFILNQLEDASTQYNIPRVMVIEGNLDHQRFRWAIEKLVQRHESLRTSFHLLAGEAMQKIHPLCDVKIDEITVTEAEVAETIRAMIKPFDLSQVPLFRIGLVQTAADKHYMVFDTHHIISDGVSREIIFVEFAQLYAAKELPPLRIQYKDFAVWQNELFKSEYLQKQEEFWLTTLAGEIPLLNLTPDYPRPAIRTYQGNRVFFKLESECTDKLQRLASSEGATLFMALLALYTLFLSKYTGQEEIIVGTPIAGRPHNDLERVVGVFANTLAMKNTPTAEKNFRNFLREVKDNALRAYENQDYQFEMLVQKLKLDRNLNRNPLFDTMLVLQNTGSKEAIDCDGLKFASYPFAHQSVQFDLLLNVVETGGELACNLEYSTELFTDETGQRMAKHLINCLQDVLQNPDLSLGEAEIISPEEKHWLLNELNETAANYPREKTIHRLYEEQALRTPERIAVVFQDTQLTYRELNAKANQLARHLRQKGVQPDTIVGILLERSLEMVIGLLAILKAGGAYLPLDPDHPFERKEYTLRDSQAVLLITRRALVEELEFAGEIVELVSPSFKTGSDNDLQQSLGNSLDLKLNNTTGNEPDHDLNLVETNKPSDLAYVLYTSGSTGKPKGVMIEHYSVVRLLVNEKLQFEFTENDVWSLFHSFCFDLSVWESYGAFFYGGKTVIIPKLSAQNPREFLQILKKEGITVLTQTPTAFYNLSAEDMKSAEKDLKLRYIIFAGEALRPVMLRAWKEKYPATKLINMYGITETTVHSTFKEITFEEIETNVSNIGVPIPTLTTYVLDKNRKLVPVGIPGELYVGGDGVARGYWNQPELTAARFIPNPYKPTERVYKSGDLVKILPTGEMEYLGRIDRQIKIRGFRVELGEVERLLLSHKAIADVVVIDLDDAEGGKYLVAYLVPEEGLADVEPAHNELAAGELRRFLASQLPEYMVPAHFVLLEKIPLTVNGKVDRRALPAPGAVRNYLAEYIAPANALEEEIARIWSEVLGIQQVSVTDNFFELGGDSFKALKIVTRLEHKITLTDLFKNPTIAQLAVSLETNDSESTTDRQLLHELIPIRDNTEALIICAPYAGGSAIVYRDLAMALSDLKAGLRPEIAVFSIAIPGHDWGCQEEEIQSFTQIAENCLAELQTRYPEAGKKIPLIFYGHCVGSVLALAMARLAEETGLSIKALCLGAYLPAQKPLIGKPVMDPYKNVSDDKIYDLLKGLGGFEVDLDCEERDFFLRNFRHDIRCTRDYLFNVASDKKLQAPLINIIGEIDPLTKGYRKKYLHWCQYADDVRLKTIANANHYFQKPQAHELASLLAELLKIC